jgi:hypothetical protein
VIRATGAPQNGPAIDRRAHTGLQPLSCHLGLRQYACAFRRIAALNAAAHGDPHLTQAARTAVFHDGFAAGAAFAVIALLVSVTLLPRIPRAGTPTA